MLIKAEQPLAVLYETVHKEDISDKNIQSAAKAVLAQERLIVDLARNEAERWAEKSSLKTTPYIPTSYAAVTNSVKMIHKQRSKIDPPFYKTGGYFDNQGDFCGYFSFVPTRSIYQKDCP